MQTVDILIIAVGALALIGTVSGVYFYEPSATDTFDIMFATTSVAGPSITGLATGDPGKDVTITHQNVTTVQFKIAVAASGGAPVTTGSIVYEATVTAPDGTEFTDDVTVPQGSNTRAATITIDAAGMCAAPATLTVAASSNETALASVDDDKTCLDGTGAWNVVFTARSSETVGGATSFTAGVTTTVTSYSATAGPHVPEVSPVA